MQCCEIKELLSPYLDGVLNPSEGEAISAHLAVCSDCQIEWHALREVVDLFKTLPEVAPPSEFSALVINKIKASPPPARKKSGVAAIFSNLTRGHWSRTVALAATVVFTVGVTALMFGMPGKWGTKNLFLPQAEYSQNEGTDSPDQATNERPESPTINRIFNISPVGSESVGPDRTNIVDNAQPDKVESVADNRVASPTAGAQPEKPDIKPDSSNGQATKQVEQLKSLLAEQARGDSGLSSSARTLAAAQTMAVKEGAVSQQAAFGYIPVSNKESQKVIHSASLSLVADDPVGAPAKLADIARSNGGYLLPVDPGGGGITVKAPADRFNQVVNAIQGMGRTTIRQIGGEDVSEKYFDYEVRLRELADEEQRLLAAVSTADTQAAQAAQLTQVREELERQKKQLNSLSNEVELATIKINLEYK